MLKILLGIILMQSVSYLDWMNVKKRVNWHTNWKDEDEKMIVSCLCVNLRAVLCRFLISISQWCHKNKHATLKQTTEFLYPWFNANTRCGLIKSVCKQTHKHSPAGSQTARVIKMHSRFNTHTHILVLQTAPIHSVLVMSGWHHCPGVILSLVKLCDFLFNRMKK